MSARFAMRPASAVDPARQGRPPADALPAFARSFLGDAPIHLAPPLSGLIVVVAFGLGYAVALA